MTTHDETFGHEPVQLMKDGFGYEPPVCARCWIRHRSYVEAVPWPCTSAVILGLAPRQTGDAR